jgi:hypothetical protein
LEIVAAGCGQSGIQPFGPFLVGFGEPPHLVGGQAEITEHHLEGLAGVNRVLKPLTHLDW